MPIMYNPSFNVSRLRFTLLFSTRCAATLIYALGILSSVTTRTPRMPVRFLLASRFLAHFHPNTKRDGKK